MDLDFGVRILDPVRVIPHSAPTVGAAELREVSRVLRSGQIADPSAFERALSGFLGAPARAVHSGSAALHLALLALGVGKGQRVGVPAYACAAVLHAVKYTGAEPVFLDCNEDGNVTGVAGRVSIVPHMFGLPSDVRGPRIVEDFAMALGARRPRGPAMGSFYATKVITTGHGGFVSGCDVDDLISYDNRDDFRVRYNYRMSGIAAAVGAAQLRRLPLFIKRRRRIADYYFRELADARVDLPARHPEHVYYRYVVRARNAEALLRFLRARGIEAKRPVYRPLHLYFPKFRGKCRGAEDLWRRAVSIPLYPSLALRDAGRVVEAIRAFPG